MSGKELNSSVIFGMACWGVKFYFHRAVAIFVIHTVETMDESSKIRKQANDKLMSKICSLWPVKVWSFGYDVPLDMSTVSAFPSLPYWVVSVELGMPTSLFKQEKNRYNILNICMAASIYIYICVCVCVCVRARVCIRFLYSVLRITMGLLPNRSETTNQHVIFK